MDLLEIRKQPHLPINDYLTCEHLFGLKRVSKVEAPTATFTWE